MSGTEATATLSLEIDTRGAELKLKAVRDEYDQLLTSFSKSGPQASGMSKVSKDLDEATKKIADLEGKLVGAAAESESALATLRGQVAMLHASLASPERKAAIDAATRDERTYRTVVLESLKEQRAERTRSAAHIASYYQEVSKGARATSAAVKSMVETMEMRPATMAGMSQYYGALEKSLPILNQIKNSEAAWQAASNARIKDAVAGITLQKAGLSELAAHYRALEAADRETSIVGAVKNLREQEAAERASADARVKAASKGIQAKQAKEREYTLWFAKELDKRDKDEAASGLRSVAYLASTPKQQASQVLRASIALDKGYSVSKYASEAVDTAQSLGSVTAAKAALDALSVSHKTAATSAGEHAKSTKLFTDAQINAHSAARGLAGSLGTLWMTYGAIVPLMAGAALGAGFKSAAKAGSEFAYQLTFVKALGGESAEAVAGIGAAALSLSKTSMYGPVELANGLRILSQAGLNAAQSMEALPTAMNLATVGEMNMEQASLTLIGVMNAFGMSMSELPHIGDMFAKAAALSQTSVAGMTEAMKTASVVHDQYGASVEDTATALTLPSQ